jgi:hypothetical protein
MPSWPRATIWRMSGKQITMAAANTARSIRRRLAVSRSIEAARATDATPVEPPPAGQDADDARLDTLRGDLVRELDRLAAADAACSAGFRRV